MIHKIENVWQIISARKHQLFGSLPSKDIQALLEAKGYKFSTTAGCEGLFVSDEVHRITHPDGKPMDGYGSPGYVCGSDGPIILNEFKE